MRGLHWTEVGLTTLLLLCEVVISQLCKSPITLLDGFHTLFILLNTLFLSLPTRLRLVPLSSVDQEPPIKSPPNNQLCSVSYSDMRVHPVGALISALVLASLNIIYLTEIISFMLHPTPVRRPLLLVVIGAVSLLLKMSQLGLHWDQVKSHRDSSESESHIEVNHTALVEEEKGQAEQGGVSNEGAVGLNDDGSLHNTSLTISNPNILSISQDTAEHFKNGTCMEDFNSQYPSNPITKSPNPTESSTVTNSPLSWLLICEHLLTPFLVLVNSLVTLTVCSHSSRLCSLLVYMDPVLSLLAVFILISKAIPEVIRHGLVLLQATPRHLSVAELNKMIVDVPGVVAMHELHIWQLTDSFKVASVHVHCHAGLQYRCPDVLLGVTKVLQSVGVSCCTIQPEFATCPAPSAGSQGAPSQCCSLACGKACTGSMCCFQLEEEYRSLAAQSVQKTKEEPQTLTNTEH